MDHRLSERRLNTILEETDLFGPAKTTWQEFNKTQEVMQDAKAKLHRNIERIHQQLALEIRRNNPAITVIMGRDARGNPILTVKYRDYKNILTFKADPQDKAFMCGNSPFERRFKRYYGYTVALGIEHLAESINRFFSQNYVRLRSLNR